MATIEENICTAIETIVDRKIAQAGFDRTITAEIAEVIDSELGIYNVKYQDAYFIAYSIDRDKLFEPGMSVYILVPNNDFNNVKSIMCQIGQQTVTNRMNNQIDSISSNLNNFEKNQKEISSTVEDIKNQVNDNDYDIITEIANMKDKLNNNEKAIEEISSSQSDTSPFLIIDIGEYVKTETETSSEDGITITRAYYSGGTDADIIVDAYNANKIPLAFVNNKLYIFRNYAERTFSSNNYSTAGDLKNKKICRFIGYKANGSGESWLILHQNLAAPDYTSVGEDGNYIYAIYDDNGVIIDWMRTPEIEISIMI